MIASLAVIDELKAELAQADQHNASYRRMIEKLDADLAEARATIELMRSEAEQQQGELDRLHAEARDWRLHADKLGTLLEVWQDDFKTLALTAASKLGI